MARLTRGMYKLLRVALPHAVHEYFYATLPARRATREKSEEARLRWQVTGSNVRFRRIHLGRRCFILCNGPSVKQQDLKKLAGEIVFSVSNGYHHPDYETIAPRYHCVPQITYGVLSKTDVIDWFREMHARIGSAVLFLNRTEEQLVREAAVFPGRQVQYTSFHGDFSSYSTNAVPDIAKDIPGVSSVSIMAIQIAMYMGIEKIYLLGTDHDQFRTKQYKYFYEPTILRGKDTTVDDDGNLRDGWYDELQALAQLWVQYRSVKAIAIANGVQIINATAGGELDEFPRANLEEVLAQRCERPGLGV